MVGVAAIVIENGRVLLVKRDHDPDRGKWSVPGGLVEAG
ncbi:MAG: NUDIX domain-containing protein, partial [Bacillota bacterium]